MLSVRGRVVEVKRAIIPSTYIAEIRVKGKPMTIYLDLLEDVYMLSKGDDVSVVISRELPEYKEGEDFVARGKVFSIKEDKREGKVLISMGGLIAKIVYPKDRVKMPFKMLDEVFVKVSKLT